MGLLDIFRRRLDDSPQSAPADSADAVDAAGSSGTGSSGTGSSGTGSSGIQGNPVHGNPVEGGVVGGGPVPPAWAMLPPMSTVSSPSISRTFDVGIGTRLRAHRSADDLLATKSLGHTVNPASIGVVGGLLRAVAPSSTVATHTAGSDGVLRRRVLRRADLAAADHSHPRWPVLARSEDDAFTDRHPGEGALSSGDVNADPAGDGEWNGGWSGSAQASSPESSEPALSVTASGALQRSEADRALPVVASLGMARPISRLSDEHSSRLGASVVRTAATPVASAGGDGPETVKYSFASPVASVAAVTPVVSTPFVSTVAAPVPPAPAVARSADVDATVRSLRRRSIVEMPSSGALHGTPSVDRTTDTPAGAGATMAATPSADPTDTGSEVPVPAVAASVASSDAVGGGSTGSGTPAAGGSSAASGSAAATVPTLGRRSGLGAPLSGLPASAVLRSPDDAAGDPFAGWSGPSGVLPLAASAVSAVSEPSGDTGGMHRSAGFTSPAPGPEGIGPVQRATSEPAPAGVPAARGPYLPVVGRPFDAGSTESAIADGPSSMTPFTPVHRYPDTSAGHTIQLGEGTAGDSVAGGGVAGGAGTAGAGVGDDSDGNAEGDSGVGLRPLLGDQPPMTSLDSGEPIGALALADDLDTGPTARLPVLRAVDAASPAAGGPAGRSDAVPVARQIGVSGVTGGASAGSRQVARAAAPGPAGSVVPPGPGSSAASGASGSTAFVHRTLGETVPANGGNGVLRTAGPRGTVPVTGTAAVPSLLRSVSSPAPSPASSGFGGSGAVPMSLATSAARSTFPGSGSAGLAGSGSSVGGQFGAGPGSSPTFTWTTSAYDAIQRSEDGDVGGSAGGQAATVVQEAGSGGGGQAGGSTAQAEADLELLAGRLYERLRSRFRRELLDDRERAGLVLDRVR